MVAVLGRTNKRILESYNIPEIVKHSDFIHLMMHDEQDPYRLRLAYNAPLVGYEGSVTDSIMHWKRNGGAPEKLILGIPLFVRSFTMDRNQSTVGSACKGPGRQTKQSHRPGFMTYNEWCVSAPKMVSLFWKAIAISSTSASVASVTTSNAELGCASIPLPQIATGRKMSIKWMEYENKQTWQLHKKSIIFQVVLLSELYIINSYLWLPVMPIRFRFLKY